MKFNPAPKEAANFSQSKIQPVQNKFNLSNSKFFDSQNRIDPKHMTLTKFHSNEQGSPSYHPNQMCNEDDGKTPKFIKTKPTLTPRPNNANEKQSPRMKYNKINLSNVNNGHVQK